MKITKNLGNLLLAIFLILYGLNAFISIPAAATILAILALIAGILKLIGK
jgi:hypothetical protein